MQYRKFGNLGSEKVEKGKFRNSKLEKADRNEFQNSKFAEKETGISIIGLGCMRFPKRICAGNEVVDEEASKRLVMHAYKKGINYFDCAPAYCDQKCEQIVGKAVEPFRQKVMLSSKIPLQEVRKTSDYRFWLERSLKNMQTDYLDNYLFWGISRKLFDEVILPFHLLEEGQKAKEEGLIRRMSVSVHDTPENILYMIKKAQEYGAGFDSILCQYNLLDRKNEEVLAFAKSQGLGTLVMGPVAGGRLAWPSKLGEKLRENWPSKLGEKLGEKLGGNELWKSGEKPGENGLSKFGENKEVATSELALRYVMENKNVDCTLSGMSTLEMIDENTALADKIEKARGNTAQGIQMQIHEAVRKLEKLSQLYCTGCGYCQPCPADIKIPKILYLVNCDRVYGLHTYAKAEFEKYCKRNGIPSEMCLNCGKCEARCPQSLAIRRELEEACERFK